MLIIRKEEVAKNTSSVSSVQEMNILDVFLMSASLKSSVVKKYLKVPISRSGNLCISVI